MNWCCSGTLIGPNVVLTAGHCYKGGCADRVLFGLSIDDPTATIIKVKHAIPHPQYDRNTFKNDLAVLILESDAPQNYVPVPIASPALIEAASDVDLAGFGLTEARIFGVMNTVNVSIASYDCGDPNAGPFGGHDGLELVAGGRTTGKVKDLGKDTCFGDSGGPAYVLDKDGHRFLAGATSRATKNSLNECGDGGIYVRVDKYLESFIRPYAERYNGRLIAQGPAPAEAAKP